MLFNLKINKKKRCLATKKIKNTLLINFILILTYTFLKINSLEILERRNKMEHEKISINIDKIQNEVKNAVNAEQRYWTENDAKMRAIAQHVPTYEDFRQIVLASHLKPLDKGESLKDNITKGNKVWNSVAETSKTGGPGTNMLTDEELARLDKQNLIKSKPKNNLEFLKIWRTLEEMRDDDAKWAFIKGLDENSMHQLCQLNGELLGKFLILFRDKIKQIEEQNAGGDDAQIQVFSNIIAAMLQQFTKCNRFELNRMFLKKDEIDACKNVLKFVKKSELLSESDFVQLEKSYSS